MKMEEDGGTADNDPEPAANAAGASALETPIAADSDPISNIPREFFPDRKFDQLIMNSEGFSKNQQNSDENKNETDPELEKLLALAGQVNHGETDDVHKQDNVNTDQCQTKLDPSEAQDEEDSKINVKQRINSSRRHLDITSIGQRHSDFSSNGRRHLENSDTDILRDADNALGSIVCCIYKCEALLSPTSGIDNCDKVLVSVLCKLKNIKDNLGNILVELAGSDYCQNNNDHDDNYDPLQSFDNDVKMEKNVLPQMDLEEYLVKAEIHSDEYDVDYHDNDDKDFVIPNPAKKVKLENGDARIEVRKVRKKRSKKRFCKTCDTSFKTYSDLVYHRKTCVPENVDPNNSFKCEHCNKLLPNEKGLMIHISKKHTEYKCEVCVLIFHTKIELQAHRKKEKHYTDDQKVFCDKCDKVLLSQLSYKSHLENFHSKKHVCKMCEQTFDAPKELREHLKNTHSMKIHKNYPCATCASSFESIESLRTHLQANTNHKSYICESCNNAFATDVSLKIHIKNRHSQKFECSECGEILDNKMEIRKHMSAKHSTPKQSICQTCGYTTFNRTSFGRHLKIHGARKHKCEFCEKSFHVKFDLITHLRVHTGEKPYVCQVCGAAFSKNGGLSRHRKIHTGEKPFVCYLCGKGFNQRGNLKTHMKSHINGTLQPPKEQPI